MAAVESARAVRSRADHSAGTTVGVVVSVGGGLLILVTTLGLLGVSAKDILLGGAVLGLVLAAALQQTLSNLFARVVLLLTHPFTIGERIRIRGSFVGGELSGTVLAISLLHAVLDTEDGVLRLPNAGVNAAPVGPCPKLEPAGSQSESRSEASGHKTGDRSLPQPSS
jgi:small-conductance mechanosensitive channel